MDNFSVDNMQRGKLAVHIVQALFIFVSWCLLIAVLHSAIFAGASGWYFALCFLSAPAIIYNTMTPLFPRSRKWANPYAFAAVDVVFAILWLSAFASLAAYNTAGLCAGACEVSKAAVGLGFFIFLFFVITSAMSIYGVIYYRREGTLPGASRVPANAAMIDPDREAFDTAPHDDEYAPVHANDKDHDHEHDYAHEMNGSGLSGSSHYDPTSYGGSVGGRAYVPPSVTEVAPSYRTYGEEPTSNLDYGHAGAHAGRAHFPAGNYDRDL